MGSNNFRDLLPNKVAKLAKKERDFAFYDEKLCKLTEAYYLESGLYSSITDILEAMKTLKQERKHHKDTCIIIKVIGISQNIKLYLRNKESNLAISGTDLGHMFGGDVRKDLGIVMRGKGPHKPTFAYDLFRIHSLMIYTNIVEYNIV